MFGVGISNTAEYQLYTIDAVTGALTSIGNSIGRPSGIAFIRIPEPHSIAMALTLVLIMFSQRRSVPAQIKSAEIIHRPLSRRQSAAAREVPRGVVRFARFGTDPQQSNLLLGIFQLC